MGPLIVRRNYRLLSGINKAVFHFHLNIVVGPLIVRRNYRLLSGINKAGHSVTLEKTSDTVIIC